MDRHRRRSDPHEQPVDVVSVERTGEFRGLYHVLGGRLSPLDGIGPDELGLPQLAALLDEAGYRAAWDAALTPLLARQDPGVTVLRDYHAENIMLLDGVASEVLGSLT